MPDWTFHFPSPVEVWLEMKAGDHRGDVDFVFHVLEMEFPFTLHWALARDFGIHLQRFAEWQRSDAEEAEVF